MLPNVCEEGYSISEALPTRYLEQVPWRRDYEKAGTAHAAVGPARPELFEHVDDVEAVRDRHARGGSCA